MDLVYDPDSNEVGFQKHSNFYIVENAIKLDVDFTLEIIKKNGGEEAGRL